jgi:hypothetical protein
MREYARVMRTGGYLVASIANRRSYIFNGAAECPDGSLRIAVDPYGNREGYRLQAFADSRQIEASLAPFFGAFSFGSADNDYYGICERVFWVVCQKK